jgi:hypothetical protein
MEGSMKAARMMFLVPVLVLVPAWVLAHTSYTGYSGAPGSNGTCASSCHGVSGGTITVTGFPSTYTPGQSYTVKVAHNGGAKIQQFNGSCRIGTSSTNAGVIASSYNTATYNVTSETNGVHLAIATSDSGKFLWTAPAVGTGQVRLYVAGTQTTSSSGPNTTLVLSATEGAVPIAVALQCFTPTVPRGGTLQYQYTFVNSSAESQTFKYWAKAKLPNQTWRSALAPTTYTLGPLATLVDTLSQTVPTAAPPGIYEYWGYVGPSTSLVWDSDVFNFTVTRTAGDRE